MSYKYVTEKVIGELKKREKNDKTTLYYRVNLQDHYNCWLDEKKGCDKKCCKKDVILIGNKYKVLLEFYDLEPSLVEKHIRHFSTDDIYQRLDIDGINGEYMNDCGVWYVKIDGKKYISPRHLNIKDYVDSLVQDFLVEECDCLVKIESSDDLSGLSNSKVTQKIVEILEQEAKKNIENERYIFICGSLSYCDVRIDKLILKGNRYKVILQFREYILAKSGNKDDLIQMIIDDEFGDESNLTTIVTTLVNDLFDKTKGWYFEKIEHAIPL